MTRVRFMETALAFACACVCGCGCGGSTTGDGGTPPDGTVDGGATSEPVAPESPMPPMPPTNVARACATGWVARDDGSCAPFTTPPSCTGATAAIPGSAACVAIGSECPDGSFAMAPSLGDVLYVLADATAAGDGTLAAPFDTLARAVTAASSGTAILLSKGRHVGDVTLPAGVHLRGACASETVVTTALPAPDYPTLLVDGADTHISDLTLTGPRPALIALDGGEAFVTGVLIDDVPGVGMLAQGGRVEANEVVVRDVRTAAGAGGRAADAVRGGTMVLHRSMIENAAGGAVFASSDGQLDVADVVMQDVPARGISLQAGADATIDRVAMLRVSDVAFTVNDPGTTAIAHDLFIDEVRARGGADVGRGVSVGNGGSLEAAGLSIANTAEGAIFVSDEGSTGAFEDVALRDIAARAINGQRSATLSAARVSIARAADIAVLASTDSSVTLSDVAILGGGRGFRAQVGAHLTVGRARVEGISGDVVIAGDEGTVVSMEDLDASSVSAGADGLGRGVAAFDESTVMLRRVRMRDVVGAGVYAMFAHLDAEDVDIERVAPLADGAAGYGMGVLGGTLDATRTRIVEAHVFGAALAGDARATLRDLWVSDTRVERSSGLWGRGMDIEGPATTVSIARAVIADNVSVGVFLGGAETRATLTDLVVRGTTRRTCSAEPCIEEGGVGLVCYYSARVGVSAFVLEDNAVAGAQLGLDGEIDLSEGEVRRQPIGVSIQTDGYDIGRLTDRVRYIDNETNLDATGLPVPSEAAGIMVEEPPMD